MKKTVLIPTIIILLFSTCKKERDCPSLCPCDGLQCHDEVKAWTYFEEGTWWIYEEESTGVRDCVHVYSADVQWVDGIEIYEWRAHSELEDYNYYYRWQSNLRGEFNGCQMYTVERTKTRPGDFVGTGDYFSFPFLEGAEFPQWILGGSLKLESFFDSLDVLNETYRLVSVHHIDDCASEGYLSDALGYEEARFFHSKNIGIIRKERIDEEEIWNLVEYQIDQ